VQFHMEGNRVLNKAGIKCALFAIWTSLLRAQATNSATVSEDRWPLCGQLGGLWVAELRSTWDQVRDRSRGHRCVIDLSDAARINARAVEVLSEFKKEGPELVAKGPYTKRLIENLNNNVRRGRSASARHPQRDYPL
jgi:hypothetical protein